MADGRSLRVSQKLLNYGRLNHRDFPDHNKLAHPTPIAEFHDARDARVKGMVLTDTDVLARVDFRAALPEDNRTTRYQLATKLLYTQSLRL